MLLETGYGVIKSGTTPDSLLLWGERFPVLEVNVESEQAYPRITIADSCGLSRTLELDFTDAVVASRQPVATPTPQDLKEHAGGWRLKVELEPFCRVQVVDPQSRYYFNMISGADGLTIWLRDIYQDGSPRVMALTRESLQASGVWPVMPVSIGEQALAADRGARAHSLPGGLV